MTKARSSPAYQRMRAQVRQVHAIQARPCALCGKPIDYGLRYPNRASWSLDHIRALHAGGALLDPANTQAAHLRCNASRGSTEGNLKRKARRLAQRAVSEEQQHTSVRW